MSRSLSLAGAVLTLLGAILLYAREEILDAGAIAAHARSALSDESVRRAVAPTIADAIAAVAPASAPTDPRVAEALSDPRLKETFAAAAGAAADGLAAGRSGDASMDLAQTAATTLRVTEGVAPADVGASTSDFESARIDLVSAPALLDLLDAAHGIASLGLILLPLGLLALASSVALAPDRLRGLSSASLAVAVAAGLLAAALYVGREVAIAQFGDELVRDGVSGAWSAVFGGLQSGAIVVALAGAAVALGAGAAAARGTPAY